MLTKNELKYYSSLNQKKFRNKENKFIAEGCKIVEEGLNSFLKCEVVLAANNYFEENRDYLQRIAKKTRLEVLKNQEFEHIADTVTPQGIAAVFNKPVKAEKKDNSLTSPLAVCLENISDPGNAGTIIRTCDWFGIKEVLVTGTSADIYNPKTIRSSMGSIFHLKIFEDITVDALAKIKTSGYQLLCSDLKGENIYNFQLPAKSIIIFSNEASGPSREVIEISNHLITIPKAGKAESLNVASAAAVILARFTN